MGVLGKVANQVDNHLPVSIRIVAKELSKPNAKIGSFRGRAVSFSASVASAGEAILFLVLATLTKLFNAITLGKTDLKQLGDSFLKQSKNRSISSLYLLKGTFVDPEGALRKTLDKFDEIFENPEIFEAQRLEKEKMRQEEESKEEQTYREQNPLYFMRL